MGWKDNLLDASFRGVMFDCDVTDDSSRRDIVHHEYPYRDGADLEDLGRKARQIHLRAVFFGDDYDSRLQALLAVLDQPGAGELVHPVFGSIPQVQLLDYRIEHAADDVDSCRVALQFAEHTTSQPFFNRQLPAQQATLVTLPAASGLAAAIEAFCLLLASIRSSGRFDRINALRSVLGSLLQGLRWQVPGYITAGLDAIDYPRAFAADISGMLAAQAAGCSLAPDAVLSDWRSLSGHCRYLAALPLRLAGGNAPPLQRMADSNGMTAIDGQGTAGSGAGSADTGLATPAGTTPIAIAEADLQAVTALLQVITATTLAQLAATILAAEIGQPAMTPPQLEAISADVRTALQQAIDSHRALFDMETARPVTEALKSTAHAVQAATASVLMLRPPLIRRRVGAAANLHLLAFRWYGDYTRASELARLNPQLAHPNFIPAGEVLNGYAE